MTVVVKDIGVVFYFLLHDFEFRVILVIKMCILANKNTQINAGKVKKKEDELLR